MNEKDKKKYKKKQDNFKQQTILRN